jgi:NAD(P)-dependent dehydrogenase (short-subunit alcohol dehydrogenase family)
MTQGTRRLRGRSAIVTGSTSGIGLGIARALAREGANVMLNGFGDAGAIAALRDEMQSECDVRVVTSDADIAVPGHVRAMVAQAIRELLAEQQPSREFATPEQLGALTVFLCSDEAAQIRGAALPVDGGWTAQ